MAGYLFGLDSIESLVSCIQKGVYSTRISVPNGIWRISQEGTFADYCSMREGDNVYFFIERKIYGIGQMINVGDDCKYLNYPSANQPRNLRYRELRNDLLLDEGQESINLRFICLFRPTPFFFRNGIDMDDVLSSNPGKFKILRVFWKLSFIKFSDEENQAFKDILLRSNYEALLNENNDDFFNSNFNEVHREIHRKIQLDNYQLDISHFLSTANDGDFIRHEMAVEAALIYQISTNHPNTIEVFERWDYLSHQVPASPFKPVDYMDKMDVFGYSYIDGQKPTIGKYLLVELKKGAVTGQDLLQLMKYVDWIKNEYSNGDYSMINAFLVGYEFDQDCFENLYNSVNRNFIHGVRPSTSKIWNNVKLVQYRFDEATERLTFEVVANANE